MNIRTFFTALLLLYVSFAASLVWGQDTKTEYAPASPNADPNRPGYELILDAKLVPKGKTIERGMVWRVFGDRADENGQLPLVATAKGGTASFTLNAGTYLVHAAFGRAGGSKRVVVDSTGAAESFVLQAGGLQLNATAAEQAIPEKDLRFSIFELEQNEDGDRKMIALNVAANKIVQLHEGTYHVLSRYGTINATVRADLEVKAGQVTRALLQHRGAAVSLRLVSRSGGDPVANTAWDVFTQDGEKVFSSRSVAPSLVLAEGTYEAAVQHGDNTFLKTFDITPGQNARLEILLNE